MTNRDPKRGARLCRAMAKAGVSVTELAQECDRSLSTVSGWRSGAELPASTLGYLCQRLAVSADWLLTGQGVTPNEQRLLADYRALCAKHQRIVRQLASELR